MATTVDSSKHTTSRSAMEANFTHSSLVKRDLSCVWHPFTQAQTAPPPIAMIKGRGAYLYSEKGEAYLDANSSWWVNLHGHAHPYIIENITSQAKDLEHVHFAGCTHPQAIIFAERLLSLFAGAYSHVFYSDNGSTSVEVALKMALQVKANGKKLLSFQGAYHGDTFGAMAAAGHCDYHRLFWPYLFEVYAIPPPLPGQEQVSWQSFEQALATNQVAAFIFEPCLQAAGGMRPYSSWLLSNMLQKCREQGIVTIADEVMTGFGRTGPLFASPQLAETPDLICLSKGITGGFLPLGATLTKQYIFDAFLSSDPSKAFLHGHSYTANPLACAAANASLDLLLQPTCTEARKNIEIEHNHFQKKWKDHPKLKRCDVIGTVLALEYQAEHSCYHHPLRLRLMEFFSSRGILVRPIGNVLYILPPYCITSDDLQKIYSCLITTLEEW